MKPEKFFFPLMVFAAVIAVYMLFRKREPATVTQPSTSASGLPLVTPQAQNYNVNPAQVAPSPLVMLADPFSHDPNNPSAKPPSYLAFNFGPSHDLTKTPTPKPDKKKNGCSGSCNSCDSCSQDSNTFPDGQTTTRLSSSRGRQVAAQPDWIANALANLSESNLHIGQPIDLSGTNTPAPVAQTIPASVPNAVAKKPGPKLPKTLLTVFTGQNPQSHPYTMASNFASSPYLM